MADEIDDYLDNLEEALEYMAPSLVEAALTDAEEHLHQALADARKVQPELSDAELARSVIENFGQPEEVAQAYRVMEQEQEQEREQPIEQRGATTRIGRFISIYRDWPTLTAEIRIPLQPKR